jgi:hypothetical protein
MSSADPDVAAVRTRTQIALFGVASDGQLEKKVAEHIGSARWGWGLDVADSRGRQRCGELGVRK